MDKLGHAEAFLLLSPMELLTSMGKVIPPPHIGPVTHFTIEFVYL